MSLVAVAATTMGCRQGICRITGFWGSIPDTQQQRAAIDASRFEVLCIVAKQ
jgi:hypothetical protein